MPDEQQQFAPSNELETALFETSQGRKSIPAFFELFVESDVHVPSSKEVNSDGTGFRPLLFDTDAGTMMSVFTGRDRAKPFSGKVPYCLTMKGRQLLQRVPEKIGIVLNPSWDVGMEIPSQGVADIRRDFTKNSS